MFNKSLVLMMMTLKGESALDYDGDNHDNDD